MEMPRLRAFLSDSGERSLERLKDCFDWSRIFRVSLKLLLVLHSPRAVGTRDG